ncbi:MAG: T9SS type A sorting domain-containing protein [Flavobacteriales bacterium]
MKKQLLTVATVLLAISVNAQIDFEQILPPPPAPQFLPNFPGLNSGSAVAFADVDGDNYQDMLIAGYSPSSNESITILYLGDGTGEFTEVAGTPFANVSYANIVFTDVDGDMDQDVFVTGTEETNWTTERISKLYLNDGSGGFTEDLTNSFEGVASGSIAVADVDGDYDFDILVTGSDNNYNTFSALYLNDGSGLFSEAVGAPFDPVENSSVVFADVDGDNDQDVLITGSVSWSNRIAKLYTNDGTGVFTEVAGTPFDGVMESAAAFSDVDGDNDQDILITGRNATNQRTATLYLNNGTGIFSQSLVQFEGVEQGDVVFADIDGDNDNDVLICGSLDGSLNNLVTNLYSNNGTGNFTELVNDIEGSMDEFAFADVDGDTDLDLFGTGYSASSELFLNDGSGVFSRNTGTPFEGALYSSMAYADVDGDLDLDLLVIGEDAVSGGVRKSSLYQNDGTGGFTEIVGTPFDSVSRGAVVFADIDGDDDEDILITGINSQWSRIAKLYTNDGSGVFTEVIGAPLDGGFDGDAAFADVDGDDDLDLLITGTNNSFDASTKLYLNDGSGVYTDDLNAPFEQISYSTIVFADVDGDDDEDVIISGETESNTRITKLYINDGLGGFTESVSSIFDIFVVSSGSIAVSDIDGDNDVDLIITGVGEFGGQQIVKLYSNNGTGVFTETTGNNFIATSNGSLSFADVDSDNDFDLLITGRPSFNSPRTKLYQNDGSGLFTEVLDMPFDQVRKSSSVFFDVDSDNDLDLVIAGESTFGIPITKAYRNISLPLELETEVISACVSFTWRDGVTYTTNSNGETFTVEDAAINGADSVYTLDLTINSLPDVTTALVGATLTANNTSATSYQWLDCDNGDAEIATETGVGYMPSSNGNYAVEITENGCADTSDCVAILTVGILENALNKLSVYPNPTENVVSWNGITAQTAELFDNTGRSVLTVTQPNGTVDVSELTDGIYIIKLFTEEGAYTARVVKQ